MSSPSTDPEQAPIGFSSPHEEALLHLMRTADCLHRAMQLRLKPSGLTTTQYNVLRILRSARPNGLTCSAIGRRMVTPEPDITRLLGRLKTQKLLSQQRDRQARRVVWTRITPHGLAILAGLDGVVADAPRELLKDLTREELKEWTRLMQKAGGCEAGKFGNGQESPVTDPSVTGKLPSPRSSPLRRPLE